MTERKLYPELNEKLVRQIQDMLKHQPQWFGMGVWGEIDNEYDADEKPLPTRIPGASALLKDHEEPNYCNTTLCLAGTACLLTKRARWFGFNPVTQQREALRAGKVRAEEIELDLVDGAYSWTDTGAEAFGIDRHIAYYLFHRGDWPFWTREMYEVDGAIALLQALLDDQDIIDPDEAWLEAREVTVMA